MQYTDDNILIKKCLKKDSKAQRELYNKYKNQWFMCCLRYASDREEGEDMMQDGLVSVFMNLEQFDSRKSSFSAWSYRIMVNASLQYLRKWNKINQNTVSNEQAQYMYTEPEVYDQMGSKELLSLIQKLPAGYRAVFNLYVFEGYKHHEIADILDISVNTSKSQLFKAKRMLKGKLQIILQN